MGGGGGKPQNIFKLNRGDDPRETFNWRLWFAVVSFGIMGAARGEFRPYIRKGAPRLMQI